MTMYENYANLVSHQPLLLASTDPKLPLLRRDKQNEVLDLFESQLEELIQLRKPQAQWLAEELAEAVNEYKALHGDQGTWVYYPWSKRLLHILSEDEFIEVRTNRNCNKITAEQQRKLGQKRIGVIGLSVG